MSPRPTAVFEHSLAGQEVGSFSRAVNLTRSSPVCSVDSMKSRTPYASRKRGKTQHPLISVSSITRQYGYNAVPLRHEDYTYEGCVRDYIRPPRRDSLAVRTPLVRG